jgi:hypothetical protein
MVVHAGVGTYDIPWLNERQFLLGFRAQPFDGVIINLRVQQKRLVIHKHAQI